MAMTLLTGPVASGKSSLAARMASSWDGPVTVIATAEALDEEMAARIERHRADRPASWTVVEEPRDLEGAVAAFAPDAFAIVDCLTLWVTNLMLGDVDDVEGRAGIVAETLAARAAPSVVVTNEVGWGIVPANDLARAYREVLGRVNGVFAAEAERVLLVVAGRMVELGEVEA
ncbi:MAG: bifunctional adenosylcobinamide kinase/adenosylcobinamide-phosphate guanylyltransferase [Ilumatobacteraceae bacterium]